MQYSSMNSVSPFYQDSADAIFRSGVDIPSGADKNTNKASPTKLQKLSASCGYKQIKLQNEGQNPRQDFQKKKAETQTIQKIQQSNKPGIQNVPQKIIKPITILSDNGIINKNISTSKMNDKKLQDFQKKYTHDGPIEIPNPNTYVEFPHQYQNQSSGYINNASMMPSPLYNSALQAFFNNDPNTLKSPDDFTLNPNPKMYAGMNTENYMMGPNNVDIKNNSALLLQEKFRLYMRYFRENVLIKRQLARVEGQKKQLIDEITELENRSSNESISESEKDGNKDRKRKRHRRNANQIIRNFICPVTDCDRMYGTEPSLLQHIKLKHNKEFKKFDNNLKKMYAAYGKKVDEN